jgi:predicted ATPase
MRGTGRRVAASPLRGRAEEMARAHAFLHRAGTSGKGGAIFISGEPGIGKSALLAAISADARAMNFAVGAAKADERDQIAPMAALLMALRSGPTPLLTHDEFAGLAPLYAQQLWLVDRLAALLEERAIKAPVLVAIDDSQWIDWLSGFALRLFLDQLVGSPIIWVLASRASPEYGINQTIATLAGETPMEHIELGRLSSSAVVEIAVDRRGAPPNGQLLEMIKATDGYPFLAVELIDGYDFSGSSNSGRTAKRSDVPREPDLPITLVAAAGRRLRSLSTETLRFVQVASVFGRRSSSKTRPHFCISTVDASAALANRFDRSRDFSRSQFRHYLPTRFTSPGRVRRNTTPEGALCYVARCACK